MTRQETNKEIIKELEKLIDKYPDMRFCQLLWNIGIHVYTDNKDAFYDESSSTLELIKNYKPVQFKL